MNQKLNKVVKRGNVLFPPINCNSGPLLHRGYVTGPDSQLKLGFLISFRPPASLFLRLFSHRK